MAKSERQKSLRKKVIAFGVISYGIWLITSIVMVTLAVMHCLPTPEPTEIGDSVHGILNVFSDEIKAKIMSLAVTVTIGLIGTIIIKEKMRAFMWMACVVIAALLYNQNGMYIIFGIWLVDEYVFRQLYIMYKNKWKIRKEIDS